MSLAMMSLICAIAQPAYVSANAAGANDGSSWANAFTNLQDALASGTATEIWVAAGTYRPAPAGGSATESFNLRNGVALFGGFSGTETARAQRNATLNVTILSGDLNGDDGSLPGPDNSGHVVRATGTDLSAVVDGFTIQSGNATQASYPGAAGAGVLIEGGTITLRHCVTRENLAQLGAGLFVYDGTLTIEHCRFENNLASQGRGGGIYASGDTADAILHPLVLRGCTFSNNTVTGASSDGYGGAIYADFDVPVEASDCSFINNEARWRFSYGQLATGGGAIVAFEDGCRFERCTFLRNRAHDGGALWLGGDTVLVNCLLVGNEAYRVSAGQYNYGGYGGAIIAYTADVTVSSCTLHANHARSTGGIYVGFNSAATVANSILWSNTATEEDQKPLDPQIGGASPFTLRYSCVRDLLTPVPGEDPPDPTKYPGCITNAPLFINERGPDNIAGNADDNVRLQASSPCIDSGSNPLLLAAVTMDLAGSPRRFDAPQADSGMGPAPITDMGAYEFVMPLLAQIRAPASGETELSWNGLGAGWSYTVEQRESLSAMTWDLLAVGLTFAGYTNAPGSGVTQRFFRVKGYPTP